MLSKEPSEMPGTLHPEPYLTPNKRLSDTQKNGCVPSSDYLKSIKVLARLQR